MPELGMITPQHLIYIPSVLVVGLLTGYMLGARAVRADLEQKRRRMKE
jgi:hypothetical protein